MAIANFDTGKHADAIEDQVREYVENAVQVCGDERQQVLSDVQDGLNDAYSTVDGLIDDLEAEIDRLRGLLGDIENVDERTIHEMYTDAWDSLPDPLDNDDEAW